MSTPPPLPRRAPSEDLGAAPHAGDVAGGFLRRSVAWSLDAVLCALPVMLVGWPLSHDAIARVARDYDALLALSMRQMIAALQSGDLPIQIALRWLGDGSLRAASDALQGALWSLSWPLLLAACVLSAAYHVLLETSSRGATLGQRALSLRVVMHAAVRCGSRSTVARASPGIGIGRALLRHTAGIASWLTLNLGHVLMLVPPSHRTLHDRIAGTQLVQPRPTGALPAWGWAWLVLLLVLQGWAMFAWALAARASIAAGLDAAQTASVSPVEVSASPQTSRHMKYITPNITT